MKAVMLVENTALFATRLLAEHGFSLYIEDDEQKILYDTGCTDTVVKNAVKLGIKLPSTIPPCTPTQRPAHWPMSTRLWTQFTPSFTIWS